MKIFPIRWRNRRAVKQQCIQSRIIIPPLPLMTLDCCTGSDYSTVCRSCGVATSSSPGLSACPATWQHHQGRGVAKDTICFLAMPTCKVALHFPFNWQDRFLRSLTRAAPGECCRTNNRNRSRSARGAVAEGSVLVGYTIKYNVLVECRDTHASRIITDHRIYLVLNWWWGSS